MVKYKSVIFCTFLLCNTVAASVLPQNRYGDITVKATLFNAPCNIYPVVSKNKATLLGYKVLKPEFNLMLTNCGAGKDYHAVKTTGFTALTPVKIRFYHTLYQRLLYAEQVTLLNGENKLPISLPNGDDNQRYRLEVTYE